MYIKNLTFAFGLQDIFSDVNIQIKDNSHTGIIGVNGAGKSTFFNLILGKIEPDEGKIILKPGTRIGFLPQVIGDEIPSTDISVFDFLLSGRPIKELEQELSTIYEELSTCTDDKKTNQLLSRVNKVQQKLDYFDQYNAESELLRIIAGMSISDELLDLKVNNLSGGQKSKVAFARLLYSKPDILLLDEPTNHLDQDSKDYIINYLRNYHGMVLVISHDIDFLNDVTDNTLYVDKLNHSMELYPGNYEKYLKIRKERELAKERLYNKQVKEEEKLKRIIAKYIGGNEKKANIAKDRIKKLEKLEEVKVTLDKKEKTSNIKIHVNHPSGIIPIKVENLKFGYTEDKLLYDKLTFDLERGEKFLIIGENGIGKSTLLKLIMNELTPMDGKITINDKCDISYYAQEHEGLNKDLTIIDSFKEFNLSKNQLRSFLGNFLFHGDDVFKKISYLSPGERSRVALAKISLSGANTLILDEPTNHLDPETQKIIADTFKDFEGTMLVVSHNLEFVDNLGISRMLLLPSGEIKYYDKEVIKYYEELNNISKYKKRNKNV